MKTKLFACDLDDTLLNANLNISESDLKAMKELEQKNICAVVCTGRPEDSASFFAKLIHDNHEDNYVISFNGSLVSNISKTKTIFSKGIALNTAKEIINIAKKYDIVIQVFDRSFFYIERITERSEFYTASTRVPWKIITSLEEKLDFDPYKIILHGDHEELLKIAEVFSKNINNDFHHVFSKPYYLEILPKNVNKGVALQALCQYLKIDLSQTAAAGDNYNDVEMLELVNFAAVPSNAVDKLKTVADYVSHLSHDQSAISEIINLLP